LGIIGPVSPQDLPHGDIHERVKKLLARLEDPQSGEAPDEEASDGNAAGPGGDKVVK
jgi:hypothetical protein